MPKSIFFPQLLTKYLQFENFEKFHIKNAAEILVFYFLKA